MKIFDDKISRKGKWYANATEIENLAYYYFLSFYLNHPSISDDSEMMLLFITQYDMIEAYSQSIHYSYSDFYNKAYASIRGLKLNKLKNKIST